MNYCTNQVHMIGTVVTELEFSHEAKGVTFYMMMVSIKRLSGIDDIIPVIVSEKMINFDIKYSGRYMNIIGEYRSFNQPDRMESGKKKLFLFVYAKKMNELPKIQKKDKNHINLSGYICKTPIIRLTPVSNTEIADILLAVNQPYNRSYYIPCICWNKNVHKAGEMKIGDKVFLSGSIQSRQYVKYMENGISEKKVAYEVSIRNLWV